MMIPPAQITTGTDSRTLERLKSLTDTPAQEKLRLKKATKEFEAFFLYQLLKSMRKTVPENPLTKGNPFAGGMGKQVFTDMFDMELGKRLTKGNSRSISDIMYKSLEGLIDSRFKDANASDVRPPSGPLPIERLRRQPTIDVSPLKPVEVQENESPIPLSNTSWKGAPVRVSNRIRQEFGPTIDAAAQETRLDSALIEAVIRAESSGNPAAVSRAGAKGLMQLTDTTAADLGVSDSFDPDQNIRGGSRYLASLLDRFGNLRLALAAYNAGPGTVERYEGIPPYAETQAYVDKVLQLYRVNRPSGTGE